MADVRVEGRMGDTIFRIRPLTEAAGQWLSENVNTPEHMQLGGATMVEHRYLLDLVNGLLDNGFTVDHESGLHFRIEDDQVVLRRN